MAVQVLKAGHAIIWLPPRAAGERVLSAEPSLHVLQRQGAGVVSSRMSIDALPALRQVTLVFDARDVTLLSVTLPALTGARLRRAVPNVVEELLLQEPQSCLLALGPRTAEGPRTVAAIDRNWFERVVSAFEQRRIRVAAAWPAQLALPPGPDGASLLCINDGLALRLGDSAGIGWSAGEGERERAQAIASLLDAMWPPSAEVVVDDPSAAPAPKPGLRRLPVAIENDPWMSAVRAAAEGRFEPQFLPLAPPPAPPIDFMQARREAASGRRLADVDWRAWRWPAALAAASVVVALVGLNLQWRSLSVERDGLRAAIEQRYRTTFPQAQVIVDPVLQMERQVAGMRTQAGQSGAEDFLPMLARLSQALGPQAGDALAGVEYRAGRLRVRFQPGPYDARAARDALVQSGQRVGLELRFEGEREPVAVVALAR